MSVLDASRALLAPWKKITIGGKSKADLLAGLVYHRFLFDDNVRFLLEKTEMATLPYPVEVALAGVEIRQLGFEKAPTAPEVWGRIPEAGYRVLPLEAGFHLRFQLGLYEQENQGSLLVATERFKNVQGRLQALELFRDEHECGIAGCRITDDFIWPLGKKIVVGCGG